MATILSSPFFVEQILPFLLVFTVVFAILDKTKVLGDGKRQINAIVALIIGLFLIAFPFARDIIVYLMPFLAVVAVIILVFLMLYSFAGGGHFTGERWIKITFGILVGLALIIAVLVLTDYWKYVEGLFTGQYSSEILSNIFFVAIIIAAIAIVLAVKGGGGSEGKI